MSPCYKKEVADGRICSQEVFQLLILFCFQSWNNLQHDFIHYHLPVMKKEPTFRRLSETRMSLQKWFRLLSQHGRLSARAQRGRSSRPALYLQVQCVGGDHWFLVGQELWAHGCLTLLSSETPLLEFGSLGSLFCHSLPLIFLFLFLFFLNKLNKISSSLQKHQQSGVSESSSNSVAAFMFSRTFLVVNVICSRVCVLEH